MTDVREDLMLFANEDWAVTQDGLEHRTNGYFIARDELGHRRADGLWTWPVHMAEKLWCGPQAFAEAFMQAVRAYGLQADAGLALSFYDAGCVRFLALPERGEDAGLALPFHDAGRIQAGQMGFAVEDAPALETALPALAGRAAPARPRFDAREATAHPWRRNRVARAGLTLLQWLRLRGNIK
jgi:hypothetical protein